MTFQDFLRFRHGVMNALRLPIHFGEALADDWRLGVQRVGLLVKIDSLGCVFGLAGVLVLLFVDVAHCVVEVGVGAGRGGGGGGWAGAIFLGGGRGLGG